MLSIRICLLLLLGSAAQAQTFGEWFRQKKTQQQYLLQQIAALQVYRGFVKTGYGIAKGGLGNIGGYITSEYNLHGGYYTHLKTVDAAMKNGSQVKEILRRQQDILQQTDAIKKQNGLTAKESRYTVKVCDALLNDCDARLSDLQTILSDNQAAMSDEERLRQIGRLHAAMQDNYRFAAGFRSQLQRYVHDKQQEQQDHHTLSNLYANH